MNIRTIKPSNAKAKNEDAKVFEKHRNPVMLVLIR